MFSRFLYAETMPSATLSHLTIPPNYLQEFNRAKTIFSNETIIPNIETIIKPKNTDEIFDNQISVIREYLTKYSNFSEKKIRNRIKNIYGYTI